MQTLVQQALPKNDFRNLRFSPSRILARRAPHSAFRDPRSLAPACIKLRKKLAVKKNARESFRVNSRHSRAAPATLAFSIQHSAFSLRLSFGAVWRSLVLKLFYENTILDALDCLRDRAGGCRNGRSRLRFHLRRTIA